MESFTDEELEGLEEIGRRRTVTALFTIEQTSLRDYTGERR